MEGNLQSIVQAAVEAAMAQQNQVIQQLQAKNQRLSQLTQGVSNLNVTSGSKKTRNQLSASGTPQKANTDRKGKTPVKTLPTPRPANLGQSGATAKTPVGVTSNRSNSNRMMVTDVPESFLKTRDCMYTHIRILWGLLEENAIPQAPDMNTLKEFQHRFSEVNQIKDATENRKAADIWSVAFFPNADKSLLGKADPSKRLSDSKFNSQFLQELQKPYDLSHEINDNNDEDDETDINDDDDSHDGEVVVLGSSGDGLNEDNPDNENMDVVNTNEQVNNQGGFDEHYEDLVDEEREEEARDQRFQMMVDEANW
ncbi:hypothetical protein PGT21_015468 [Puccinia graminis f. sp. tritici]|uniref:Uncharacterized protein n=1 Tax=Puccinia graminis f. sp. tritici TaxID=56615 RepID=A0A5B0QAM8_PUCGR|nr:hypothetical protein PGT21_015468 [Puccinia graminis f. sp. tritici]